jgi:NADH dehydrogenase
MRAAERSGARRFVFFSAIGASLQSPTRFLRAKALARRAVEAADLKTTVFSPSIVYSPGDPWLTLLQRLSYLPAVPMVGPGGARFQPIWAEDAADCVVAALERDGADQRRAFDLAGPEALTYDDMVRLTLKPLGRRRRLLHLPRPLVRASLRTLERLTGPAAFATWEEAELLGQSLLSPRGTADVESLGVTPLRMSAVLGGA